MAVNIHITIIELSPLDKKRQKLCQELHVFFFSSRRRHTRSYGDWSSDVCSSDLQDHSTGPIAFTVGDAEMAPANLQLSAASSNPGLVPLGNIVFGGSGANRTVTVTPAAGQTGSATITVTVNDGPNNTSTNFVVTVSPAPPPPGPVAACGFREGSGTVVSDVSGNGNNGTISGATWTASGKYGNAL